MMTALCLTDCAVQIQDEQFCSPVPGHFGAVCDNFLTANQIILTEDQWIALQASWNAQGEAVECTRSNTLGDIKKEIERLCSLAPCSYPVKKKILEGLNKIQALGKDQLQ